MFLRCKVRRKDGKQHRYWSVVENTRTARGRVVQRHVLYLGEINDTQELAWRRSIEVIEEGATQPRTLSLFPESARFFLASAGLGLAFITVSKAFSNRSQALGSSSISSGFGAGNQQRVDADAVAAFPHPALEDIADAEFGADLFHIDRSVLIREGRVHEEPPFASNGASEKNSGPLPHPKQ